MAGKFLIVGLGNIGEEYIGTRHNIGFMVLDSLAKEFGAIFNVCRLGSMASISYKGNRLLLLEPSTYMNLSGRAVAYWLQAEKIDLSNLLVVCDDLALPFGTLRLRKKGSNGGHNGLGNIQEMIGTTEYCRLKVGIGSDFAKGRQIDFVLGAIEGEELQALPAVLERAKAAIKDFIAIGPDRAMNIHNTAPSVGKAQ